MAKAKYLWSLMKNSWRNAVDITAALFVSVSFIDYVILGHVSPAASYLSSLTPIVTALLFASSWLFLMFFMSLRETRNWIPIKRWLCVVLFLMASLLSCYLTAITKMRPGWPLSNWMCKEEVGWTLLVLLSVAAIVIVITGKDIKNHQIQ